MKLKKFVSAIAIAALLTSAYAQGLPHDRVIVDFTRTDRLTGTPVVPPNVIPTQQTATGSMCGLYASGGLSFTCLGYDPSSSCPSGYYSQWFPVAEGHWWASCIKS